MGIRSLAKQIQSFLDKSSLTLSHSDFVLSTAAWLAQLGEHRSVEREVAGSSPGRTNTQGLNNN